MDWNNQEIGGGWVFGDFTYGENSVDGFSEKGKEKVKNNKILYIPEVIPSKLQHP